MFIDLSMIGVSYFCGLNLETISLNLIFETLIQRVLNILSTFQKEKKIGIDQYKVINIKELLLANQHISNSSKWLIKYVLAARVQGASKNFWYYRS